MNAGDNSSFNLIKERIKREKSFIPCIYVRKCVNEMKWNVFVQRRVSPAADRPAEGVAVLCVESPNQPVAFLIAYTCISNMCARKTQICHSACYGRIWPHILQTKSVYNF